MAEGFLRQKENVEMGIQSFPSLDLHCVGPVLRNKLEEPKGCSADVCLKHRSVMAEGQEEQVSKR